MIRKIYIKQNNGDEQAAITEDDILVGYLFQKSGEINRGTVLMGYVKDYVPSLGAFFIDAGTQLPGFLPEKFVDGKPKTGSPLVLQVVKPPLGSKGMTLSSKIAIAGDMCVISGDAKKCCISFKIKDKKERQRLESIARENGPDNLGITIRTNAAEKTREDIIEDIKRITTLYKNLHQSSGSPGKILYTPEGIVSETMRSFDPKTDIVYFNDMETFDMYFKEHAAPGQPSPVKFYDKDYDMFAFFSLSNRIKEAAGKRVRLKSGGTLIFDYTEAMCVIDVNTSKNTGSGNFEDTAFKTNMEAAGEIAVQIRLRNIGGIIIIDFIDMNAENNDILNRAFRKHLSRDDRKMTVGGFTSLGNFEITRIRKGRRLEHYDEQ